MIQNKQFSSIIVGLTKVSAMDNSSPPLFIVTTISESDPAFSAKYKADF